MGKLGKEEVLELNGIEMKYAKFLGSGFYANSIFDLNHEWNRDGCFYPYFLLRKKFIEDARIQIDTFDVAKEDSLFELHMDVQKKKKEGVYYLLMLESPQIFPPNGVESEYCRYRKIFTWRDDLLGDSRFVKINFPNNIRRHRPDGFERRDRFCCMIASNRVSMSRDDRILYSERINVIRWFEVHAPGDFDLYGADWDVPPLCQGRYGRLQRCFWKSLSRLINLKVFQSYRGSVVRKIDVLDRTRFSICYENVRDLPGYITEKIFDCFFSGCVPIYWGASNITDYIPEDCFIDRRKFKDMGSLYCYLKNMSESDFIGYQERIAAFLESDSVYPFSSECFAETIVSTIVNDLNLN